MSRSSPVLRSTTGNFGPAWSSLYSAHTMTVEAVGNDHYHHVWFYTVSPQGRALAELEVRLPLPSVTRWGWADPTPERMLESLSEGEADETEVTLPLSPDSNGTRR